MDGSDLEEKSRFKILQLFCYSKLDRGCYIISIAKTTSKKVGALICSMKFLSPKAALYLCKSTIRPCMDYCCHIASLSLFYRYYCGRCLSELAQLVPFPYSRRRSTRYSDRLHDISVIIRRCYKNAYCNSFSPHTARLWNCLPRECFL